MLDRETIIRLAIQEGVSLFNVQGEWRTDELERFAALVAAAEREAIAEHVDVIAEDHEERGDVTKATVADQIAAVIRARKG